MTSWCKNTFLYFFFTFVNRELVVKGTFTSLKDDIGHYPHWEDPDGFMAAYQHFLSKFIQEK